MEIALDLDASDGEDAGENDDRDDEPRTSGNSPYPSADQEDDLPTVPQKRPRSAVSDLDDEHTNDSDMVPRVTYFPASPTASEVPAWQQPAAADELGKHVAMAAPHLDPLLIPPLPIFAAPGHAIATAPAPANGTVSSALTTPAASPLMSPGGPLSPGTPWHMYSRHNFAREGAPSPRDVTLSFLPPPAIASRESSAEPVVPAAIGLMGPPTAPPPRTGLVLPPPVHAMPLPAWERFPAPAPPAPVTVVPGTGAWSPGRSLTSRSPSPGWTVARRGASVSRETTPAPPAVTDGIMMGSASPTPARPSPTKVRVLGSTGPFGFGVEDSPTRCNDHGEADDGRGRAPSPTP
ncbi:hypothetical protein AMAG_00423 [Allomyces macrogynus ATCC 38327]|uniref:Uncharacterized protein n=1 Tax=Allomyces macrogynus (strain ATCC 38327) TaxID=578462 RepID=A0A0L0RWE5_ALLM3|nr:hypothetical protein AMAG_00423 [Allomyces macrogynus ATCC 38327]|eukprot:KNE54449.1 hypothetical protein AMAG_00423 [Allomyces macrogynus ATCC 38327]